MQTKIIQTECPQCGAPLNTTSSISEERRPKAGDVCLCMDCGCAAVLDDDMQLRLPTEDEMAEFEADPKFHEAKKAIQADLAQRKIH